VSKVVNFLLLGIFTLILTTGQLLFKRVGLSIQGKSVAAAAAEVFREPTLYGALATYGVATLLWIWILGRVPLVQAYPWIGAGLIIVPLLSSHFFGERVAPTFWLGAALIAGGLVITQLSIRS
jgi:multidrug transporter EmrE-like cation transporter